MSTHTTIHSYVVCALVNCIKHIHVSKINYIFSPQRCQDADRNVKWLTKLEGVYRFLCTHTYTHTQIYRYKAYNTSGKPFPSFCMK